MAASREVPVSLRSARWFAPRDLFGFLHRTALRSEGFSDASISGRPVIGIANSHSELVNCNLHFGGLIEAVKRGVHRAGGLPLEFPTISLSEMLMKPTTMLYRNLMSMDVEEMIRSSPLDAVVLVGGCDKTVPAQLMGAASAGVPAIALTGGPMQPGNFRGRRIGAGTDIWRYTDDLRAGRMSADEYAELEAATRPGVGHCSEMGTASTMATLTEVLGMSLPGSAAVPATDARRGALAEETGRRAVEIAREGLRPATILTLEALENAVTALAAVAGSTNAVLHLIALAGRLGIDLPLDRFDEIAARTPVLTNIQPAGEHLFEDLQRAGGVPALLGELAPLLHLDAVTVTGADARPEHRRGRGLGPRRAPVAGRSAATPRRAGRAAWLPRPRRRRHQGERRLGRTAATPGTRRRLRWDRRPAGTHRRSRVAGDSGERPGAAREPARRGRRACPNGACCPSPASCWRRA